MRLYQLRPGSTALPTFTPMWKDKSTLKDVLNALEKEEIKKEKEQLQKIRYYEEGLETILDIRCSFFKSKDRRFKIQDDLLSNLLAGPGDINHVIGYDDLKAVFDHDHQFCDRDRKSNGKLRQLYVKNWRLQVERDKYKNIVDKLKLLSPSD